MDQIQRTYVPLSKVKWRFVLGAFATLLICLTCYRQLDFVANGEYRPVLLTFAEEATGAFAGLCVFPLVYAVAIRFSLISTNWRRNLLVHFLAVCLISLIHTSVIVILRSSAFPMLGLGADNYGYIPVRYPMEFAHFFIFYWVGVSLIWLFHEVRFAREREVQQAKLEATLAQAQLQNLRLQLEPHFLFNALNAISATIYEDARAADEMVCRLADLLRQLLKSDSSQQIPLSREVELLRLYTRIMQARLESRLVVRSNIDEDSIKALVPQLLLQPLIENSIRHGMEPVTFQALVDISASRRGDQLQIVVRDHGPGFHTLPPQTTGIGLPNTRERLARLYGNRQTLRLRNAGDGGAIVEIDIPFEMAANEQDSPILERIRA